MLVIRHLPRLIEVAKQSKDPRVRESRRLLSNMLERMMVRKTRTYKNHFDMTTIRYARYVVVNEKKGGIFWHDNKNKAQLMADDDPESNLYDYNTDNLETIETALGNARRNMGVE